MSKKLFVYSLFILWNHSAFSHKANTVHGDALKAIVIGASSGMGREIAKRLGEEGYTVGLAARKLPLLESLQKEIKQLTFIKQIDANEPNARAKLTELITEMNGVDLVVISISSYLDNRNSTPSDNPNAKKTWEQKERTINVDAKGFIALADVALEHFKQQNRGHLVGISSTSGLRGVHYAPEYAAAKACISTYMEGKRNELYQQKKDEAIKITDIVPGYVAVEHSPLGQDPMAYWEITTEQASKEIMHAIQNQKKVAYIPAKVWIVALLLKNIPDYVYNKWLSWL